MKKKDFIKKFKEGKLGIKVNLNNVKKALIFIAKTTEINWNNGDELNNFDCFAFEQLMKEIGLAGTVEVGLNTVKSEYTTGLFYNTTKPFSIRYEDIEDKKQEFPKITKVIDIEYDSHKQTYQEEGTIYDKNEPEPIQWDKNGSYTARKKSQKIIFKGRKTTVIVDHLINGELKRFVGIAYCQNNDEYNETVGKR